MLTELNLPHNWDSQKLHKLYCSVTYTRENISLHSVAPAYPLRQPKASQTLWFCCLHTWKYQSASGSTCIHYNKIKSFPTLDHQYQQPAQLSLLTHYSHIKFMSAESFYVPTAYKTGLNANSNATNRPKITTLEVTCFDSNTRAGFGQPQQSTQHSTIDRFPIPIEDIPKPMPNQPKHNQPDPQTPKHNQHHNRSRWQQPGRFSFRQKKNKKKTIIGNTSRTWPRLRRRAAQRSYLSGPDSAGRSGESAGAAAAAAMAGEGAELGETGDTKGGDEKRGLDCAQTLFLCYL